MKETRIQRYMAHLEAEAKRETKEKLFQERLKKFKEKEKSKNGETITEK